MALSEREQQVLRDLEEQLHDDDPRLVDSMTRPTTAAGRLSPRHIGGGVALLLSGLAVLIGGVAVEHGVASMLIGVAGFALAVWGVTLMLTRVDRIGPTADARPGKSTRGRSGSRGASFMDRQSERWDRRRDGER